ncbi:hypothetical protein TYRP_015410 [Tyrophagus putrescentiae]|nr:hypothetical protein TYRP_015410 [Tyrophagus putrescentiae]
MPVRPVEALKTGKVNDVDLMFGTTRNEGSAFVAKILPLLNPDTTGKDLHIAQVKSMIKLMFLMFSEPHYAEVVEYYTKGLNESDKTALRLAVSDAFGDYHLICPTVLYGEQFAKVTPTRRHYAYKVSLPTSIGIMGCRGWMGVCHGEDVVYVFGVPVRVRGLIFSEAEYRLSRDMILAWTNFAKTGVPGKVGGVAEDGGGNRTTSAITWTEALDQGTVDYLNLDSNDYRMVKAAYRDKCDAFWKPKIFA